MYIKKLKPLRKKVWLASPTMHKEEKQWMNKAYESNWVSTVGENINEIEKISSIKCNMKYAVGLSCCTAALHLAVKLAAEKLYGKAPIGKGALYNKSVFCSDMTFSATINPIIYEGGSPIFIDSDYESWNMNPKALEKAFKVFKNVKIVIYAELYGFPGNIKKIKEICKKYHAILIEDAAEALGAYYANKPCGSFGDLSAISFNGNKIITGSSGGCFLTNDLNDAQKIKKWSTQARENATWYQHEELGYNYRMSNIIAGIIRGQYLYLEKHIKRKKEIYERYKKGLKNLPISMNPIIANAKPNYWLSAILINKNKMAKQTRTNNKADFKKETNKSCPTEILDAIFALNAEGRPIWKPMHMQPIYKKYKFVSLNKTPVNEDIFNRGLCLPSDIKMSNTEQDIIIEVIKRCFE